MSDIDIVSKAILKAKREKNEDLVRAIRQDINITMLSFQEIVVKYDLQ